MKTIPDKKLDFPCKIKNLIKIALANQIDVSVNFRFEKKFAIISIDFWHCASPLWKKNKKFQANLYLDKYLIDLKNEVNQFTVNFEPLGSDIDFNQKVTVLCKVS